jgi:hypothetical protein
VVELKVVPILNYPQHKMAFCVDLLLQNDALDWKTDVPGSNAFLREISCGKCTSEFLKVLRHAGFAVADAQGNCQFT